MYNIWVLCFFMTIWFESFSLFYHDEIFNTFWCCFRVNQIGKLYLWNFCPLPLVNCSFPNCILACEMWSLIFALFGVVGFFTSNGAGCYIAGGEVGVLYSCRWGLSAKKEGLVACCSLLYVVDFQVWKSRFLGLRSVFWIICIVGCLDGRIQPLIV